MIESSQTASSTIHLATSALQVITNFTSSINQSTTSAQNADGDNYPLSLIVVIATLQGMLVLCTTVGNSFVIAAVWKEKSLQTLTNKIVASLAVTDLLVGLLVMPLQAAYSLLGSWPFGDTVCGLFIAGDVLFCTSSILHLVAIAVDRYWSVTRVTYNRGSKLHKYVVPILITGCWLLSAGISLPPFLGWRTEQVEEQCIISQDRGYTIYSTVGAFYLPLIVIMAIYTRIFFVVRARVRRKPFSKKQKLNSPTMKHPEVTVSHTMVTIVTEESLGDDAQPCSDAQSSSLEHTNSDDNDEQEAVPETETITTPNQSENRQKRASIQQLLHNIPLLQKKKHVERSREDKLAVKRERKAFRTLVIITGVFVTCWLPFFIVAISYPFKCPSSSSSSTCSIPKQLVNFVTWLGYVNCMLNPIIYNIFNPDFRRAFKKILLHKSK